MKQFPESLASIIGNMQLISDITVGAKQPQKTVGRSILLPILPLLLAMGLLFSNA
jgi:hypothetical protein